MQGLDSMSPSAPAGAVRRSPRAPGAAPSATINIAEIQPLPRWTRSPGGDRGGAFFAGAGLALFDAVLRSGVDGGEPVFAGCLRQRLALKAAESCATLARLREDAGALRDAEHLSGGAISPAGRLHRLFRLCPTQPPRLDAATLARAAAYLDLSVMDAGALAQALAVRVAAAPDPLAAAVDASVLVMTACAEAAATDAELFSLWVADLALSSRLDWPHPVPLLAVVLRDPALRRGAGGREMARRPRPLDAEWPAAVALAYGLAAAEAHALACDLSRRAARLAAVAPKLRAGGAGRVIEMLLADDGVTPAAVASRARMSDRGARRLFDRLVALGAVRELSGRDTFRIYGL